MAVQAPGIYQDPVQKAKFEKPRMDNAVHTLGAISHSDASSSITAACPDNTAWTNSQPNEDVSHQIISSYFIGPQAENLPFFERNIHIILKELRQARHKYFPEDGVGHPLPESYAHSNI